MFTQNDKKEILKEFTDSVDNLIAETCGDIDVPKFMQESNVDAIKRSITKVHNNVIASVPEGIPAPKVSVYTTPVGADQVDVVTVSITNRYTSNKKFKFSDAITERNASPEGIANIFKNAYTQLILDSMIEANIQIVNEAYQQLIQRAEVGYAVEVVSPLNAGDRKVAYISDDKVCFVADESRIFDLEDLLIFVEPDGMISEEDIEKVKSAEVETLQACQTPVQLVEKHGGSTISYIADINKQVRAMTLIKKVCTKDYSKIKGNKETLAFWAEGDDYALVVKREDGHFDIVLSPFNIKTLRKADVDVLSKIA